jgi:hypothetical protein
VADVKRVSGQTQSATVAADVKRVSGQTQSAIVAADVKRFSGQTQSATVAAEVKCISGQTQAVTGAAEVKCVSVQTQAVTGAAEVKYVSGQTQAATGRGRSQIRFCSDTSRHWSGTRQRPDGVLFYIVRHSSGCDCIQICGFLNARSVCLHLTAGMHRRPGPPAL